VEHLEDVVDHPCGPEYAREEREDEGPEGAGCLDEGLERRHVLLKGHPIDVLVLPASPVPATAG
jgi:hypothetical protein